MHRITHTLATIVAVCIQAVTPLAAQQITSPKDHFGFNIGDDYHLATYTQFVEYWHLLDAESDRMVVQEIGRTAEGRPQLMAIVTSPENHATLARYQEIANGLALAEGIDETAARAMAEEGKAVIWIDGGLHATEVLGAHQLIETVYEFVSMNDPETLRILDDVIILFVHANPDGMELVSNWYMRNPVPEERSTGGVPRLYHKYVGHDNNRDSYLVSQPETENMARILYIEWMPQIMYNHHQVGPSGTVMWAPPFRYPANYNFDPLVLTGIEQVGSAMQARFAYENKPGVTQRNGGPFSTWWNGGLRTTAYFHNIIGLLTETQGNPTPITIPFMPNRILPDGDNLLPIAPQEWHFGQSIEYSITANRAVLDYASRYRTQLLMNIWRMGKNQIERGSGDHWTLWPKQIDALVEKLKEDGHDDWLAFGSGALAGYFSQGVPAEYFESEFRKPERRDPRGYILPSDQADFGTATKFVNTLIKNGVTVHRATRAFTVSNKEYAGDSYVVMAAQAYRAHVMDMFEPQDHPNDFKYEGGPPNPPYDNAGYTLALQMGVEFDRMLEAFDGPFEKIEGLARTPAGTIANAEGATGYLVDHAVNDAAVLTNRLLEAGEDVFWLREPMADGRQPMASPGTIYIPATPGSRRIVEEVTREFGFSAAGTRTVPGGSALQLNPVRIGLWDRYGGSMPSGWVRWLFEGFEFPYELVFPQRLDAGNLGEDFDVLVFVTDAIPERDGGGGGFSFFGATPDESEIPAEYREWLGRVTVGSTVPHLVEFLEGGGTIVTIGTSAAMAKHAGLPLADQLADARGNRLSTDEFYIPGSVVEVAVDNTKPLAYGMPERVNMFFVGNTPVMRMLPAATGQGVVPVAWYDSAEPLVSGWAWGQNRLEGGIAAVQAKIGQGNLFVFGPEVTNRGQPHGTFKFLFNGIFLAGAEERRLDLSP